MLHHIDVTFEPADHVQVAHRTGRNGLSAPGRVTRRRAAAPQDMPRRLRRWARSLVQKRGPQTVSAERPRPDAALLIDLTSPREAAGKALSVAGAVAADATQTPSDAGAAGGASAAGSGAVRPGASLAERKQAWAERELAIRSLPAQTDQILPFAASPV
jgi:hypothetical protein